MKAISYQLKIIEKKARPVIWRRALIPYGITFSVLAYLLNEIMELEQPDFFQMKFTDERVYLRESKKVGPADFHTEIWYDIRNAKNTFIEDYFTEGTWFSYSYGTEKEYRVEIEKIESEYAVSIPMLLGFSRADPLSDADKERTKEHTRRLLKNCMCSHKDKAEFMSLSEIYSRSSETGIIWLPAMNEPESENDNYFSDTHRMLKTIGNLINERAEIEKRIEVIEQELAKFENLPVQKKRKKPVMPEEPVHLTQKQFFMAYDKKELLRIAKGMNIRVTSAWKKSELAEIAANEVLRPTVFRKPLMQCSEAELEMFRVLCKEDDWYIPEEEEWYLLEGLYDRLLVFIEVQDRVTVSVEMKKLFEEIDTRDFRDEHASLTWFRQCLYAACSMYGSVPVNVFCKLYSQKKGMDIDQAETERLLAVLSDENDTAVLMGDRLVARELTMNGQHKLLEKEQGDKEFYIPDFHEIEMLYDYKYPLYEPDYQGYIAFLKDEFHIDGDPLFTIVFLTYRCLAYGGRISDVVEMLENEGLVFSSEKAARDFAPMIISLSNHTRMAANCGYTPIELAEQRRVLSLNKPVKKMQKVYPNDPCPCGSGKKYKKCCGRK